MFPVFAEETQLQKEQKELTRHTKTIAYAVWEIMKEYDQAVFDIFVENMYKKIDDTQEFELKIMLKDIVFELNRAWYMAMHSTQRHTNEEFNYSMRIPKTLTPGAEDMTQFETLVSELPVPGYEDKGIHVWIHGYDPEYVYTVEEDLSYATTFFKIENKEEDIEIFMNLVCGDEYAIDSYAEGMQSHYFAWIENSYLSVVEKSWEDAWWCIWTWRWSIKYYPEYWIAVHHGSVHAVDFEYVLQDKEWNILSETTIPYFQGWNVFFK